MGRILPQHTFHPCQLPLIARAERELAASSSGGWVMSSLPALGQVIAQAACKSCAAAIHRERRN
ncbi:MAG TPA: hypothetical protein VEU97_11700 [Ktedonobacteraceae bacterium]|nr:hypothetical protein [Ktedonobacteraceae bacterium]